MTDLDEIVESFKLNIDRVSPERLEEVYRLILVNLLLTRAGAGLAYRIEPIGQTVSRARLNEILDMIEKEDSTPLVIRLLSHNSLMPEMFIESRKMVLKRVREEVQKTV